MALLQWAIDHSACHSSHFTCSLAYLTGVKLHKIKRRIFETCSDSLTFPFTLICLTRPESKQNWESLMRKFKVSQSERVSWENKMRKSHENWESLMVFPDFGEKGLVFFYKYKCINKVKTHFHHFVSCTNSAPVNFTRAWKKRSSIASKYKKNNAQTLLLFYYYRFLQLLFRNVMKY